MLVVFVVGALVVFVGGALLCMVPLPVVPLHAVSSETSSRRAQTSWLFDKDRHSNRRKYVNASIH